MSHGARPVVRSGLEVLLSGNASAFRGKRIGLIGNAASVDSRLGSSVRLIGSSNDFDLRALFGPEHGWHAGAQDMVAVPGGRDAVSGMRIHTLYGETPESLSPSPEMLENVDVLIGDLQDIGTRYYTFAATLALALKAISTRGGRLVVLDRPNPLGGLAVEGPGVEPAMHSFVGHIDVPVRHGLTMAELLVHHARKEGLSEALDVVPMQGWSREMRFEDTGLPWVPPSPNMPTLDTARVYPGACLLEATNLSEGRGTTRPFEWLGAPFLDAESFAGALAAEELPGVIFRPHTFVPSFHKWAGQPCGGVALHLTDPDAFQPVRTGVAVLMVAHRLAPAEFAWRVEPYEFVTDRPAIDLLTGGTTVREGIAAGVGLREITSGWDEYESAWLETRRSLLLYS